MSKKELEKKLNNTKDWLHRKSLIEHYMLENNISKLRVVTDLELKESEIKKHYDYIKQMDNRFNY